MLDNIKVVPRGRMFSVQYSLPRLPVPPLQQTLDKYLRSVRPLVTDEEFKTTQKIVQKFLKSPGPELQAFLEKKAANETNWLSEWWRNVAYLDYRVPLVVNFNPAVTFPQQAYRGKDEQLRFAAKIVAGVLDYKIMVDEQTLPVEMLGGKPLCMMQYYQIMSACRIPGIKKDSHEIFLSTNPDPPKHICVIHNNHIFSMDVYGLKGKPLNVSQLYKQLKDIVSQSQYPATPVGLLTSLDRDTWGSIYHEMIKDKTSKVSLKQIHRSIFVLCLDKPIPKGKNIQSSIAREMLHGDGEDLNSGNRWFDKTLQFIVGADGACGLNYEHTSAEGPPVAALLDHVLDFVGKNVESGLPAAEPKPSQKLTFNIPSKVSGAIELAAKEMESLVKDVQVTISKFESFGKNFIKGCRLSPDAFIQLALQLAYYRMHNRPCATYETASLRQFQLGRTETIRSCSVESLEFTQGMQNASLPDKVKVALLKEAVKAHRKYTDEAVKGQGVDRHLLGLKLAALENGYDVPELYLDTSFKESTYYKLSTSQVGAKHNMVMLFGPAVPDGYGLCYNPQDTKIFFSVTSYHVCSETNSEKLSAAIKQSLVDMQALLNRVPPDSKL
ncbi:hypothetical protein C0Q70_17429 [Pomacea canaliculata]|uniref:Carnitine O-acetyltransferase n=2 Tax=Pomacea canaliculata TaxID=400727 RepID=A0A2T7NKC8_POMCA|nr:carnitine O-acetyltransferase-like isoform X2 [Pomacea canaliculata]PVD21630.1 hypothetical protein C0Q70_17429 [Pomacea canaliculata]